MMPAAIIDTHCHLDVSEFDADRDAVMARALLAGVSDIVVPAIRRASWNALLDFCASRSCLHPALGLHPVYLVEHRDEDIPALDAALAARRPVAVGEIGLDYYLRDLDRKRQRALCGAQLDLAVRHDLPVILHVRKAHDDMLAMLRERSVTGGIVHAFNGSEQHGLKYAELGFALGFGGMLTFERSRKLRNLAAALPLNALVLETDAPDMTPAAHRGRRNSPEYLPECLAALAEVRGMPVEEVARATSDNAIAALNLQRATKPSPGGEGAAGNAR